MDQNGRKDVAGKFIAGSQTDAGGNVLQKAKQQCSYGVVTDIAGDMHQCKQQGGHGVSDDSVLPVPIR